MIAPKMKRKWTRIQNVRAVSPCDTWTDMSKLHCRCERLPQGRKILWRQEGRWEKGTMWRGDWLGQESPLEIRDALYQSSVSLTLLKGGAGGGLLVKKSPQLTWFTLLTCFTLLTRFTLLKWYRLLHETDGSHPLDCYELENIAHDWRWVCLEFVLWMGQLGWGHTL